MCAWKLNVNVIMKLSLMLSLNKILQTLFKPPTITHISWTTTSSSSPGAPTTTSTSTMSSMSLIILIKEKTKHYRYWQSGTTHYFW